MDTLKSVFGFAITIGYCDERILTGIKELKSGRIIPDRPNSEECQRLLADYNNDQDRHFGTLALYIGLRHGELISLAWEDIDLKGGTMTVRRNITLSGDFKLPKTRSGVRTVNLLDPALDALSRQRAITYMLAPVKVNVIQEDNVTLVTESVRFVFSARITATRETGPNYSHVGIHEKWCAAVRRAGLRYRRPYQTRHTYACWMLSAGVKPTFIAKQMGHASAKEIYQTYGDWVSEHTGDQLALLNTKLSSSAPYMPPKNIGKR
ncbi:site-specific integrase [Parasalinivibrio latis]|uniref:site-specific integrase n=1 Tax=Parasalinivibrio latis TaxID=2952610 RepID=UPI0030E2A49D